MLKPLVLLGNNVCKGVPKNGTFAKLVPEMMKVQFKELRSIVSPTRNALAEQEEIPSEKPEER